MRKLLHIGVEIELAIRMKMFSAEKLSNPDNHELAS